MLLRFGGIGVLCRSVVSPSATAPRHLAGRLAARLAGRRLAIAETVLFALYSMKSHALRLMGTRQKERRTDMRPDDFHLATAEFFEH